MPREVLKRLSLRVVAIIPIIFNRGHPSFRILRLLKRCCCHYRPLLLVILNMDIECCHILYESPVKGGVLRDTMELGKTLLSLLVILDITVSARNANWNGDRLKRRRAPCIVVAKKSSIVKLAARDILEYIRDGKNQALGSDAKGASVYLIRALQN